jgi:hypothetical protein
MPARVPAGAENILGIKELRRELRRLGPEWPKQLRKAHKELADWEAGRAQSRARSMGGVFARAATAIKGSGTQRQASISVRPTAKNPMAHAAFWGAKRQSGWYNAARYRGSRGQQHPTWVGNTWDVARRGQGPYAINEQLAADVDEIEARYTELIDDLFRRAFPERV